MDPIISTYDYRPEYIAYIKRFDNSTDATGFGKMYGIYIEDRETKASWLAVTDRFKTDVAAAAFLDEYMASNHETALKNLAYINERGIECNGTDIYEVQLCTYRLNKDGMQDNWLIADAFGVYDEREMAEQLATTLACHYFEFIELYCATHNCNGISFDVIDRTKDEAVTTYEISAGGEIKEWRDNESNGWKVIQ